MDNRSEPVRKDLTNTRNSLTESIEQVGATVSEKVDSTMASVRDGFAIRDQVNQRPWIALGASVAVGYALGSMLSLKQSARTYTYEQQFSPNASREAYNAAEYRERASKIDDKSSSYKQTSATPDVFSGIRDQVGSELTALKTALVATGVGVLRDTLKDKFPQFRERYEVARGAQTTSGSTFQNPTTDPWLGREPVIYSEERPSDADYVYPGNRERD
jgi:ElaB/YqjD/DUF883 family membrane-anchored ribosome-binding protein